MATLTLEAHRAARLRTAMFIGAAALTVTACSDEPARSALEDYPVFTQEATAQDALEIAHSDDLLADMNINAEAMRWVGEYESADFYAGLVPSDARPDEHVVCFFIAAHELEVAGASCTSDPYSAAEPTVTVRVAGTGGAVQAFLVPADTAIDDVDGWHRVSDYVIVVTDPSAAVEVTGALPDGTELPLRR